VLSEALNEIGSALKPKVRCLMPLADQGAGLPDGGLFTAEQYQKPIDEKPKPGQPPPRSHRSQKPRRPLDKIVHGEQVRKYLQKYGLALVTNYRQFVIVGRDGDLKPTPLESYSLAEDENEFWSEVAAHPKKTAEVHGKSFEEFLMRACLHNAPLTNPRDVAWFLASYARDAKTRIENHKDLSALTAVRNALEEALG